MTKPLGQFRLRIPRSLHGRLSAMAHNEGVSLNTLITTFLSEKIGEIESVYVKTLYVKKEK